MTLIYPLINEEVHYDPPAVILDRIEKMEEEVQKELKELRKMLKKGEV